MSTGEPPPFKPWTTFVVIGGVLLPIASVVVEAATGTLANLGELGGLDPIPTLWHVLLILTVPLAAWGALLVERRPERLQRRWPGVLLGTAWLVAGCRQAPGCRVVSFPASP
jgi:hypothetical protein